MVVAIVIGGALMILLADTVSNFLEKNRMYEVLGLFVLFIVGIMLLSEGGHKAQLEFFGNPVHAMSKTTFYFVIGSSRHRRRRPGALPEESTGRKAAQASQSLDQTCHPLLHLPLPFLEERELVPCGRHPLRSASSIPPRPASMVERRDMICPPASGEDLLRGHFLTREQRLRNG